MVNPNRFYTYAYLREDRTPYYVGKGSGNRIYSNDGRPCNKPIDMSRIIFLKQNLTEEEAFKHEEYMIAVFGRKDLETGILHNKTNGGDGSSGAVRSEEFKRNLSEMNKGEKNPMYGKRFYGKNNHFYGKKHTQETKDKASKLHNNLFEFTKPDGEKIIIETNLKKFCEENNLNRSAMCGIMNNRPHYKFHKGWSVKILAQKP
jgi:hypothetical protein